MTCWIYSSSALNVLCEHAGRPVALLCFACLGYRQFSHRTLLIVIARWSARRDLQQLYPFVATHALVSREPSSLVYNSATCMIRGSSLVLPSLLRHGPSHDPCGSRHALCCCHRCSEFRTAARDHDAIVSADLCFQAVYFLRECGILPAEHDNYLELRWYDLPLPKIV